MNGIKTIIWDWNGTMLNDIDICVKCINILLEDRGLNTIDPIRYRDIFTFPVRDYYVAAGFDFSNEPFEIPAHQFIDNYRVNLPSSSLHTGAYDILKKMQVEGRKQVILSVMEQELLSETVESKGIRPFFDKVCGINDHYGGSKTDLGMNLIKDLDQDPQEIIMIGDTLHDHEVAVEMGVRPVLISHGHQSKERLMTAGCPVADNFEDLISILHTYF